MIKLTNRETRRLLHNYDAIAKWICDHADLCTEAGELSKLNRNLDGAAAVLNHAERLLIDTRRAHEPGH